MKITGGFILVWLTYEKNFYSLPFLNNPLNYINDNFLIIKYNNDDDMKANNIL